MKNIKKLRLMNNLTKREFIKEFNIHYGNNLNIITYTLIEEGLKQPNKATISGMKDYYGVTKEFITQNDKN